MAIALKARSIITSDLESLGGRSPVFNKGDRLLLIVILFKLYRESKQPYASLIASCDAGIANTYIRMLAVEIIKS